jgi:phosphatidate phosphatase APP1
MPFFVLTRAGFDDIVSRVDPALASFRLKPGIASEAEIARLREAGAAVDVMAATAHPPPDSPGGIVWVESVRAEPDRTAPAVGARPQALRNRLAKTAGLFARGALERLRNPAARRQLMLVPYFGFGNAHKVWVRGRVLDERVFREQTGEDSAWNNMVALYQRLESDEVAGARVRAHFQGRRQDTTTDRGGYFSFELTPEQVLGGGRHNVELELPDSRGADGLPLRATAHVVVPPPSARFGIISDIDDTVLWTNVTNKLNMALMLARSNAHTRKPFKGVAAFYRALVDGAGGNEDNPVFYVSSSPWHLFGPLVEFLRVQGIPVGPLLLRELGVRELFQLKEHRNHKLDKIELILGFYPDMQFVLVGDSGEQDPEIYAEVVRRHPRSVRVIYIRNVNPDPSRIEALDRLIDEVSATGTQLILAPDSVFAASHAAAEGLIQVDRLASVRLDKKDDDSGHAVDSVTPAFSTGTGPAAGH